MLEQEIDTKLLHNDDEVDNTDAGSLDKEKREIDAQMGKYQQELTTQQVELAALRNQIEDSGAVALDTQDSVSSDLIKQLRERTLEIENLGMKMDELHQRNDHLDILIKKIDSFDKEVYEACCNNPRTIQQLMRDIQEKAAELEKFPRKNRHCVEWYDKYSVKHHDIKKKFEEQLEIEQGVIRLLTDLDWQKQQALEKNFITLNDNFCEIFQRIVPNGWAELKLIKRDERDES